MKSQNWLTIAGGMILLVGCAHGGTDRKLDEKVSEESAIQSRDDLRSEAAQDLSTARVSPDKKAQLLKIRDNLNAQENQIWKDSLKLRAVLIKDLLAKKYDPTEIDRIKGRMWDLENKRLTLIYSAIDEANGVLGHFTPDDQIMIDQFFDFNFKQ